MRSATCEVERANISARLDGELDDASARALDLHLDSCAECRAEETLARAARRALRVHSVEDVPNLTSAIMEAVASEGPRLRARTEWNLRLKIAAFAAVIAALVLAGSTLPRHTGRGDIASANEITAGVLSAARSLGNYRASYDIVERGWNQEVPVRRFSAEVWFQAPEKVRLLISDFSRYPDGTWPRNDVELVANPRKWWIEEPSQCPQAALPACSIRWGPPTENRTIVDRQPFDGTSDLPTDLIVPLETLVGSHDFDVAGEVEVAGRKAYRVDLLYRDAVPLVGALQAGGSWRPFNPLDGVRLWIDKATWFPLEFEVTAASSPDRKIWAEQQGLHDRPGATLLSVKAAAFDTPEDFPTDLFAAPTRGLVKTGGFDVVRTGALTPAPEPRYVAGLEPYRSGRTTAGQVIRSWTRGTTWLKVTTESSSGARSYPATAEEVRLPGRAGWAYYEPASVTSSRRIDVFGPHVHAHLESNLRSDDMFKVAASLGVIGRKAPIHVVSKTTSVSRIPGNPYSDSLYGLAPSWLPTGYRLTTSLVSRSPGDRSTLTTYYRSAESEYDGVGIRITQSRPVRLLSPSSEDFVRVRVNGLDGRWSSESGELEWLDGTTYRSVSVPSFDLATALAIARSMK